MGKSHQKTAFVVLLGLLIAAAVGLVLTSGGSTPTPVLKHTKGKSDEAPLVDQRPLQTARSLAGLAATPAERDLAQEASRLADHEVDLAFASALREAAQHPAPVSPEARQLAARVKRLAAKVAGEQEYVNRMGQLAASASVTDKAKLQQEQQLAAAQLELDKDELEDAQSDLARAGGNPAGKIERMRDEHEANAHAPVNTPLANSVAASSAAAENAAASQSGSLIGEVQAWSAVRSALGRVKQAQQEAQATASSLARGHEALEAEASQEKGVLPSGSAADSAPATNNASSGSQDAATAASSASLATLKHLAGDQKTLAEFDQRVQDEQELADVYSSWISVLQGRERAAAHAILGSILWVLLIALAVVAVDFLIDRFMTQLGGERKRLLHLRSVLRFAAEALGVLAVVLIIFGKPAQMPTILGLAGAGLTVALKDFIVGFVGWFVLMGRNGIRVGDWVEIEGVGGEVVEIGLLRTVLLEAGNWTEAGRPTGRKVAFMNSFAIEGHYFNFSTSGQWLWEELQLQIPADRDPYSLIQEIRDVVVKETEASARQAEQEWERVMRQYGMKSFSAEPAIDIQSTASGLQIVVRYMAQAQERHELRARLNHAIVELLHGKRAGVAR